jgi:hypothetical protein
VPRIDLPPARWLVLAALVLVLAVVGTFIGFRGGSGKGKAGVVSRTSTLPVTPVVPTATPPAPTLSPVRAVFDPAQRATFYTIAVRAPLQGTPSYSWRLAPPSDDPDCNKFGSVPGAPNRAVWHHADTDGCSHAGVQHTGTVSVTVTTRAWVCSASFFGSLTRSGSPPQRCHRA